MIPIVKTIPGTSDLICEGCSGTIKANDPHIDKYDFYMHRPGCRRYAELMIWEEHLSLRDLSNRPLYCQEENNFISAIWGTYASRCCPAHRKLFSVVEAIGCSAIGCGKAEECYHKYFKQHEDEVLAIAEAIDKL